jgi:hypothetical protein
MVEERRSKHVDLTQKRPLLVPELKPKDQERPETKRRGRKRNYRSPNVI